MSVHVAISLAVAFLSLATISSSSFILILYAVQQAMYIIIHMTARHIIVPVGNLLSQVSPSLIWLNHELDQILHHHCHFLTPAGLCHGGQKLLSSY